MPRLMWDPAQFARLRALPRCSAAERAYNALRVFNDTSQANRDVLREWEIFVAFCDATGCDIDPSMIEMLDPNTSMPPPPDLECYANGEVRRFELAEVVQQNIAKFSKPKKPGTYAHTRDRTIQEANRIFTPSFLIANPYETLLSILEKKAQKSYQHCGRPLMLLLYYCQSDSF